MSHADSHNRGKHWKGYRHRELARCCIVSSSWRHRDLSGFATENTSWRHRHLSRFATEDTSWRHRHLSRFATKDTSWRHRYLFGCSNVSSASPSVGLNFLSRSQPFRSIMPIRHALSVVKSWTCLEIFLDSSPARNFAKYCNHFLIYFS